MLFVVFIKSAMSCLLCYTQTDRLTSADPLLTSENVEIDQGSPSWSDWIIGTPAGSELESESMPDIPRIGLEKSHSPWSLIGKTLSRSCVSTVKAEINTDVPFEPLPRPYMMSPYSLDRESSSSPFHLSSGSSLLPSYDTGFNILPFDNGANTMDCRASEMQSTTTPANGEAPMECADDRPFTSLPIQDDSLDIADTEKTAPNSKKRKITPASTKGHQVSPLLTRFVAHELARCKQAGIVFSEADADMAISQA